MKMNEDSSYPAKGKKRPGRKPRTKKLIPEYERVLRERLEWRDKRITDWLSAEAEGETLLTEDQIKFLGVLAEKNLKNELDRQGLTNDEQKMKEYVRRKMRNAISDLGRLVRYSFIGAYSYWDPNVLDTNANRRLPFDPNLLKEDFPISSVADFIGAIVGMYGDEYAVPIAEAVKQGLQSREKGGDPAVEVDVPVMRRYKSQGSVYGR
jgi:hypothetical protein